MVGFRFRIGGSGGPTGPVGKVVLSLFFSVFLLAGVFFSGAIVYSFVGSVRTYTWQRAPCRILAGELVETPGGDVELKVRYTYQFEGRSYTSDRFGRTTETFADRAKAGRLADRYATGAAATCYVNQADPSQAVLKRDSLWIGLTVFFGLIFVAVGAGGLWYTWRRRGPPERRSISEKAARYAWLSYGLVGFFLIFFAAGAGGSYALAVRPYLRIRQARAWAETPCTIASSRVRSHTDSDGTTYSVDITYTYRVNGRPYTSNRYGFTGGSSSGYEGKRKVVDRYPPRKQAVCYVNPDDPYDAVLNRKVTAELYAGLILLVFLAVGGVGTFFSARALIRKRRARRGGPPGRSASDGVFAGIGPAPTVFFAPAPAAGPVTLKARTSRLAKFLGAVAFACVWNGIVAVFVWHAISAWRAGRPEWSLNLFLVPFVLVGLAMIGAVFYFLLAMFNPRPKLVLSSRRVPLGGELELRWRVGSRAHLLQRLTIELIGREEATYTRGTRTETDKDTFAGIGILGTGDLKRILSGAATFTVPGDSMHSLTAPHNKVVWALKLKGTLKGWPDISEEYELQVTPKESPPKAGGGAKDGPAGPGTSDEHGNP